MVRRRVTLQPRTVGALDIEQVHAGADATGEAAGADEAGAGGEAVDQGGKGAPISGAGRTQGDGHRSSSNSTPPPTRVLSMKPHAE